MDEQRILITQAQPGMVLARPVTLPNKISLCGTGTELTDDLIQRFMLRGIKRLFVQGAALRSSANQPLAIRLENLHQRFSRVQDNSMMRYIEHCIEEAMSGNK